MIRDKSQEDRTLELLKSRGHSWVPAPDLARISLQYCRAICCLRKRGFRIENRVEHVNGQRHGFYRLAPSDCLFPDMDERHNDIG
jgi:hypothetical protein